MGLAIAGALYSLPGWAQQPPPADPGQGETRFRKEYVVTPGDQLEIFVRRVPEASRTVTVRSDGQITLPIANEVSVAGLTAREVTTKLTEVLSRRLVQPEVTVMAAQVRQPTVFIGGEVNTPGAQPLRMAANGFQAITLAGGLKRTSSARNISVLRLADDGQLQVIPLDITGRGQRAPMEALARLRLMPDDIVFVPESGRSQLTRFIDDFVNRPVQGVNSILGTWVNFRLIQIISRQVSQ
jgi:polysaccharide export outer membrane protein